MNYYMGYPPRFSELEVDARNTVNIGNVYKDLYILVLPEGPFMHQKSCAVFRMVLCRMAPDFGPPHAGRRLAWGG